MPLSVQFVDVKLLYQQAEHRKTQTKKIYKLLLSQILFRYNEVAQTTTNIHIN